MLRSLFALLVSLFLVNFASAQSFAIVDVTVIPMDAERVLPHQTVLIGSGKIISIAPSGSSKPPASTRKIDGRGKFLMPGLIDAHVHLMSPDDLISYLAYGVTTVVNMSGTPSDLALRSDVRSGKRFGPNIYTAGPTIDGYPPLNEIFVTAETPEQGDAIVSDHKRAGYNFIKVYGTLRPDVFHAIASACKREHIALTGHINRQLPTSDVWTSGQVLAAHSDDLLFAHFDHPPTDTELAVFANEVSQSGMTVTANLAIPPTTVPQIEDLDKFLSSDEAQYLSAATYSRWIRANNRNLDEDPKQHLESLRQQQDLDLKFVRLLHQQHVPLILGTDASGYGFPGQSVLDELEQTRQAGLSRFEALATATRNPGIYLAKYVDHDSKLGIVTKGSTADLLLLTSNPLTADLTRDKIAGVIRNGQWISADTVQSQRQKLRQRMQDAHAAVVAADALLEQGDVQACRKLLANAKPDGRVLDEWVLLTKARKHESQLTVAIAIAQLYVELFSDRFSSHQLLADLLQKSGNNQLARTEATKALALQPHCATSANILERSTFADTPATFHAATYELRFESSDPSAAVLQLQKSQNRWLGTLQQGQDSPPLSNVVAGGDQVWFTAGQNWQSKEVRLRISPDGKIFGTWWSIFGRNGNVTGSLGRTP